MTEVSSESKVDRGNWLTSSQSRLGFAIFLIVAVQSLIFASFGAWFATCAPDCGSSYPLAGLVFVGAGALLFVIGIGASQRGPVSNAIALLVEATYLTTLGAGTASWAGYLWALNMPFWIALGFSAIAVPLLAVSWFSKKNKLRIRLGATILGLALVIGFWWHFWVAVPR